MKTFIQITKIKTVLLYIMQSFPKGVECAKLFRILYFGTTGLSCQIWKGTYRRLFYGIEVWSGADLYL